MDETTNEIQPRTDEDRVSPPDPLALDPLSPMPIYPSADTPSMESPLALEPLGPIRRFG